MRPRTSTLAARAQARPEETRTDVSDRRQSDASGRDHIGALYSLQQRSGGGLPAADPQGGDRQERRVLGLVHDLDTVPAGAPLHRRLRARQSVRLGLAACFSINAICCVAILVVAYRTRRKHAKRLTDRPVLFVAA